MPMWSNNVSVDFKDHKIKRCGTMTGLFELPICHGGLGKTRRVVTWSVACLSLTQAWET